MSVGHGGHNSKHTGLEKLFVLEYLEAKFQDAVTWFNNTYPEAGGVECKIFNPYNTCHDFFILINTKGKENFSDTYRIYEEIHEEYQSEKPHYSVNYIQFQENWSSYLDYKGMKFNEMFNKTLGGDRLHASSSNTTLFYSIEQVAKFYALNDLKDCGWRVWRSPDEKLKV